MYILFCNFVTLLFLIWLTLVFWIFSLLWRNSMCPECWRSSSLSCEAISIMATVVATYQGVLCIPITSTLIKVQTEGIPTAINATCIWWSRKWNVILWRNGRDCRGLESKLHQTLSVHPPPQWRKQEFFSPFSLSNAILWGIIGNSLVLCMFRVSGHQLKTPQ